jgi:tight adherence protein B
MLDALPMDLALPALIALMLGGLVFAVVFPYISGDKAKEKRIAGVTEKGGRKLGAAQSETQSSRKKSVADSLKEMEKRKQAKEKITMRLRLQRAGLSISPRDFYIYSAIAGCLAFAVGQLALPIAGSIAMMFVCGAGLPRFVLRKMTQSRQAKFLRELANAIDVIVRGIKSGLPVNECIQVIARESPEPLASEFREVVDAQRVGVPLGDCLERMSERVPLAEVRFLTIVIAIQQQAGGNLSEALGNLSGVLRDRFMLKMKSLCDGSRLVAARRDEHGLSVIA